MVPKLYDLYCIVKIDNRKWVLVKNGHRQFLLVKVNGEQLHPKTIASIFPPLFQFAQVEVCQTTWWTLEDKLCINCLFLFFVNSPLFVCLFGCDTHYIVDVTESNPPPSKIFYCCCNGAIFTKQLSQILRFLCIFECLKST